MEPVGKSISRKETMDKVRGAVKYNIDYIELDLLHAKMLTSYKYENGQCHRWPDNRPRILHNEAFGKDRSRDRKGNSGAYLEN